MSQLIGKKINFNLDKLTLLRLVKFFSEVLELINRFYIKIRFQRASSVAMFFFNQCNVKLQ